MNRRKTVYHGVNMDASFSDKFYKQNPALVNEHSIPVTVKRFYTQVDGAIVDKNTVPVTLQTKFPVFLLGQFDRQGGYKKSLSALPCMPGTQYVMTFTNGVNMPFLSFTGFNTIQAQLQLGDIVQVFTDNILAPSFFIWIVATAEPCSLSSIIGNTETTQKDNRIGGLYITNYNYAPSAMTPEETTRQFMEPLHYTKFDNLGNFRDDQINPYTFRGPNIEQTGFVTIGTNFKLDQYLGINVYMLFECEQLNFNFKVQQI